MRDRPDAQLMQTPDSQTEKTALETTDHPKKSVRVSPEQPTIFESKTGHELSVITSSDAPSKGEMEKQVIGPYMDGVKRERKCGGFVFEGGC